MSQPASPARRGATVEQPLPRTAMPVEAIRRKAMDIWVSVLPGADPNEGFLDQVGSSLTAIQIVTQLEEAFGVVVPFAVLVTARSIDDLVAWVASELGAAATPTCCFSP